MSGWDMRNAFRASRLEGGKKHGRLGGVLGEAAFSLIAMAASALPVGAIDVPVVNGGLGPCSADFTVTDNSNTPVYDAKIHVSIVYGFMNKRKQDLEVGTNSDGKARFEGLPNKLKKKPLEFQIRASGKTKSVMIDPEADCHANSIVVLGSQ